MRESSGKEAGSGGGEGGLHREGLWMSLLAASPKKCGIFNTLVTPPPPGHRLVPHHAGGNSLPVVPRPAAVLPDGTTGAVHAVLRSVAAPGRHEAAGPVPHGGGIRCV